MFAGLKSDVYRGKYSRECKNYCFFRHKYNLTVFQKMITDMLLALRLPARYRALLTKQILVDNRYLLLNEVYTTICCKLESIEWLQTHPLIPIYHKLKCSKTDLIRLFWEGTGIGLFFMIIEGGPERECMKYTLSQMFETK